MNFKNAEKPYLIGMFIFCLFNPIYFIGLFFGNLLINSEEKLYKKFSKEKKIYSKQTRTIFDDWPTTGVSEEEKLENMLRNQASKLHKTNSIEDVKKYNEIEKKLENFYKNNKL